MTASGASDHDFGFGTGKRLSHMNWDWLEMTVPDGKVEVLPDLPDQFIRPTPVPAEEPQSRSPSDLGGAKALPGAQGDSEELAKARGTALHELLENLAPLPIAERATAADVFLSHIAEKTEVEGLVELLPDLLSEAVGVLNAPGLAQFFATNALNEVPVTADLPDIGRIYGIIAKLLITPQKVTAIDFKSNRVIPQTVEQVPEGLLRQMGAYAAALAQIYPDREIETGLIWTASAHYMPLPHDLVTQALGNVSTP
jgi:ATP-dependent helicase/nuclease subunit A